MKNLLKLASLLVLASLALSACGGAVATTPAPAMATDAPTDAPTEVATEAPSTSSLPDLGGREILIAVENAYNPFNFIDEALHEKWKTLRVNPSAVCDDATSGVAECGPR